MHSTILSVRDVSKHFIIKRDLLSPKYRIQAVRGVSFDLAAGEILGLIGESGSGKTTLSSIILNLMKPDEGEVLFNGYPVHLLEGNPLKQMRKELQIVFQASYGALDPIRSVIRLVGDPLVLHQIPFEGSLEQEVVRLLDQVGLGESVLYKRPGQLSGGQKQRVGIARAIATRPSLLVLDEPVSALDVSVQGQIVNLLMQLKEEMGLTYLFITHDLKIARHLCDRLAVMHQGQLVEIGDTEQVIQAPRAEYTRKLMDGMHIETQ